MRRWSASVEIAFWLSLNPKLLELSMPVKLKLKQENSYSFSRAPPSCCLSKFAHSFQMPWHRTRPSRRLRDAVEARRGFHAYKLSPRFGRQTRRWSWGTVLMLSSCVTVTKISQTCSKIRLHIIPIKSDFNKSYTQ